ARVQGSVASEFRPTWNDPKVPLLIDSYLANSIEWDKLKTEPRVVAIIHKSTIGTSEIDPAYQSRKAEAKERGYLWGSYHWGVAGNPKEQADFYLDTVKPAEDELIALDLEDVTSRTLMNADEALVFINRINEKLGRYPVLYTNHKSARILSSKFNGTASANAPLWYARFKSNVTDFPAGLWPTYTLWQFSSEILFQKAIPGTKKDMDVNVFNGTIEDIRSQWPLTR